MWKGANYTVKYHYNEKKTWKQNLSNPGLYIFKLNLNFLLSFKHRFAVDDMM